MPSAGDILAVLDASAEEFVFPMFDNGYVYPAAARLFCFAGDDGWAVVFQTFGYSPRAGIPDTMITSIGEGLIKDEIAADYVSEEALYAFLNTNPNWRQDSAFPLEDGDWLEDEYSEAMREGARMIPLVGRDVPVPSADVLAEIDAQGGLEEPLHIANVARALAQDYKEEVLAGNPRRRIPNDWDMLLKLDEWKHPDLVASELPSQVPTFQSIARVIADSDAGQYRPEEANTHWSNWPDGGML